MGEERLKTGCDGGLVISKEVGLSGSGIIVKVVQ